MASRQRAVAQIGTTGACEVFEKEYVRKDGSRVPVLIGAAALEGTGETVAFVLDLTERKRAENELRANEAKMERAQRVAHFGWWERDFTTNDVSLSDEACRIFGVQPVDLPEWHGRWLEPDSPGGPAESRRGGCGCAAARRTSLRRRIPGDPSKRHRAIVHSQGDVTWDDSGRPLRQFGVMQDISELRAAEKSCARARSAFAPRSFSFDVYWESDAQHPSSAWSLLKGY